MEEPPEGRPLRRTYQAEEEAPVRLAIPPLTAYQDGAPGGDDAQIQYALLRIAQLWGDPRAADGSVYNARPLTEGTPRRELVNGGSSAPRGWISDDPNQQCCRHGAALIRIANIVFNEAGVCGDAAKRAIAYAWLNRTKGDVNAPPNTNVISNHVAFSRRLEELDEPDRKPFVYNFARSLEAACVRFCDPNPRKNDPTEGATHWVSPRSLPRSDDGKCGPNRFLKGGVCFPNWTRPPYEPNVEEIAVPGVPRSEFHFYKGVRYRL